MSAGIIQHTVGHHLSVPSIYDNKRMVTRNCDPETPCSTYTAAVIQFAKSPTSLKSTTNSTTTYITSPKPSKYPPTLPGFMLFCISTVTEKAMLN